jgi:DNA-binding MarR family transcriptional regulator
MTQAPVLTGQDIAEAEGAVTKLLERALAREGATRQDYVVLRVLTLRGPWTSPRELHAFLTGQRQLGLTPAAAAELLARLEDRGLASGTAADGPGPAEATAAGAALHASLAAAVAPTTRELYAGFAPDDLATTRRVLTQVTERAGQLLT